MPFSSFSRWWIRVPDAPAVDLQLGLAGAGAADPPRQAGEARVLPGEAGEAVLELGELHLDLPLPAVGALGEDVEDHLGAVDDLHLGEVGDRADLGGGQLVVEDEQVRPHLERPDDEVGELSPADEKAGVHLGTVLDDRVEDLDAGGAAELPKLGQRGLAVEKGFRLHPDEDGAVDGLDLARLLPSGKLAFEGGDEGGEVEIHLRGTLRGERLPVAPFGVFRDEVGGMGEAGEAVFSGLDGADEVEAQEREVREVVGRELLAGQMGVDQAQPLEAERGGTEAVERGDDDVVMGSHDDIGDLSPAGDEEAELAVEFAGELGELAGHLMGDDPLRRDAPPVELPDALDLGRSEAGQVAVNLFDGFSFSCPLFEFIRADPFFHPVEESRPGVRPEGSEAFSRFSFAAGGARRVRLPGLHDPFEAMRAARTFIIVNRHGAHPDIESACERIPRGLPRGKRA